MLFMKILHSYHPRNGQFYHNIIKCKQRLNATLNSVRVQQVGPNSVLDFKTEIILNFCGTMEINCNITLNVKLFLYYLNPSRATLFIFQIVVDVHVIFKIICLFLWSFYTFLQFQMEVRQLIKIIDIDFE